MVLYQACAASASRRRTSRGASTGLVPPPSISAKMSSRGLIDAGQRERVAGRHRVVAGADQPRRLGRFARDQVRHRGGAGLALRVRGRGGFGNAAADAGVADDVDVGHELRGKADGVDRAPAGLVDRARDGGDAAGLLRRDDVGDRRSIVAEIGDAWSWSRDRPIPPGRPATARCARSCRDTIPSRRSRTAAAGRRRPWRRGSISSIAVCGLSDNARSGWRARRAPADSARVLPAPPSRPGRHRPWPRSACAAGTSARRPSRHEA